MKYIKSSIYTLCKGKAGNDPDVVGKVGDNLIVKKEGYIFELPLDGAVFKFGVSKRGKSWYITELSTGMSAGGYGFNTRELAVKYLTDYDCETLKSVKRVLDTIQRGEIHDLISGYNNVA